MSKELYFQEMNTQLEPQQEVPTWYYHALGRMSHPMHIEAMKLRAKRLSQLNRLPGYLNDNTEEGLEICDRSRMLSENPIKD